jgi:hypothetical protein
VECKARVEALELELKKANDELANWAEDVQECKRRREAQGEVDSAELVRLQEEIAKAGARNKEVALAHSAAERRNDLDKRIAAVCLDRDDKTKMIEQLDKVRTAALAHVAFPVDGLGIDTECITYRGVPFSQASGAEQLAVSLSIAMAATPQIRDVWVRDGSLLDENALDMVRAIAEQKACRVWLERVGDRDDDAIIISDGTVVAGPVIAMGGKVE